MTRKKLIFAKASYLDSAMFDDENRFRRDFPAGRQLTVTLQHINPLFFTRFDKVETGKK